MSLSTLLAAFEAEIATLHPPSPPPPDVLPLSLPSDSTSTFLLSEPAHLTHDTMSIESSSVSKRLDSLSTEGNPSYGPIRTRENRTTYVNVHTPYAYIPEEKKKVTMRYAAGEKWEDLSLAEWPDHDFRLFVGDLANDVDDLKLHQFFSGYASFAKSKVVRDKKTDRSKGYGFVSFLNAEDALKAYREKNGKYLGSRPIKITKSSWNERQFAPKNDRKNKRT